jgi:hypothetical protein
MNRSLGVDEWKDVLMLAILSERTSKINIICIERNEMID